jgi:hypothetical protein
MTGRTKGAIFCPECYDLRGDKHTYGSFNHFQQHLSKHMVPVEHEVEYDTEVSKDENGWTALTVARGRVLSKGTQTFYEIKPWWDKWAKRFLELNPSWRIPFVVKAAKEETKE